MKGEFGPKSEFDFEMFLQSPEASDYLADSPLKVLAEWFLTDRQSQNLQPLTLEFYRLRLNYMCQSLGERRAGEISTAHLKALVAHLRDSRHWSVQNTNHFIQVVKTFFSYLEEEEVIATNPARKLKKLRQPSTFPRPFSSEEASGILKAAGSDFNGIRDGVIVLVLLDTGIRLGELMGLRADDVDLAGGQMRVFGKGRKERIVFFGQTVRKSLMRYLAIRSVVARRTESLECALWLTKQGTALAEDTLQSQLRTYGKRAKIEGVHPHRFRHTFATDLRLYPAAASP